MITKKSPMFLGKESKREETAEKNTNKSAYLRGEKREGGKNSKAPNGSKKC